MEVACSSPRKASCAATHCVRQPRGFTLVSVLIAVVLLTIGVLAVGRTQIMLMGSQNSSAQRTAALEVARTYMEIVRGRAGAALATEPAVNVSLDGTVDPNGPLTRSLFVAPEADNLFRVTVEVGYPRGTAPVQLITFVYN